MTKVICISGHAQNGKDTTAEYLNKRLTEKNKRSVIVHYADLLKFICNKYFNWDGVKDEHGRTLLQHIGTGIVRKKYPDYWVDFVITMSELFCDEWDYIIIADARFPNEIYKIGDKFKTYHLRVTRTNFDSPLSVEQQNHISETALDDYPYDTLLTNSNDDKSVLYSQIDKFISDTLLTEEMNDE